MGLSSAGPVARVDSIAPHCRRCSQTNTAATWRRPQSLKNRSDHRIPAVPRHDGKTVCGAAICSERGFEGIPMRVTNIFGNSGPEYQNTERPFDIQSFVEMPRAAKGLELCKSSYDFCVQIGSSACTISDHISAREAGMTRRRRSSRSTGPASMPLWGRSPGLFPNPPGAGGHLPRPVWPRRPGHRLDDHLGRFRDNDLRTTLCRSQTGLCNDLASFLSGAAASGSPMVSAIRRVPGEASFS